MCTGTPDEAAALEGKLLPNTLEAETVEIGFPKELDEAEMVGKDPPSQLELIDALGQLPAEETVTVTVGIGPEHELDAAEELGKADEPKTGPPLAEEAVTV